MPAELFVIGDRIGVDGERWTVDSCGRRGVSPDLPQIRRSSGLVTAENTRRHLSGHGVHMSRIYEGVYLREGWGKAWVVDEDG